MSDRVDDDFSEALRESEERYRTLFEQAPFGVFLYDRNLRITECNPAFVKVLGAPYERLLGLDLRKLKDQRVVPAIEKVLEGEPSAYEGPYQAMISGWVVQVSMRCSPLRDGRGDLLGGMGVVEDVTDRVRALEALRTSEQRLSLHVKASPLGVVGWSADGQCVEWNDSATRIFGWTADEMLGQTPERIIPEPSRARVNATASRLFWKRGGERSTNENVTKDGRIIICDWYNTALVDPQGKVIGIASLVQDITERTKAEEALKRSEARFRELIERAPDAIGVSRDGRFLYVNPAMVKYLGYDAASDLIGTASRERVHEDDRDAYAARVDVRSTGVPREFRLLRRDGTPVTAEVISMRVDYDGAPATLSFARDVTERKEMQVRLLQADRMVSVGTLAAGVAHEINNPLAYMIANLDHLVSKKLPQMRDELGRLEEEAPAAGPSVTALRASLAAVTEMLDIAREGADRVRTIVRDLKTFSRADEERRGPVDVHRVLDASINMAWNEIRHAATLHRDYGEVPLVDANEGRLGQVFLNLVVNAAQAIPSGRASDNEIRVRTSYRTESSGAGSVRVEISDTGSGIAKDAVARIFDPFYTTKPEGVGTGLGLWICQGIVTELGGSITVESRVATRAGERSGTTVSVSLPARSEGEDVEGEPPSAQRVEAPRGRVLIVDDEPAVARALRNGISDEQDVAIAVSGREALAMLLGEDDASAADTSGFDVILCDLMMPDLSGIDLYEALVARRPELAERVVFITGGAFTPQARTFIETRGVASLEKPFDIMSVRELVRMRVRRNRDLG